MVLCKSRMQHDFKVPRTDVGLVFKMVWMRAGGGFGIFAHSFWMSHDREGRRGGRMER